MWLSGQVRRLGRIRACLARDVRTGPAHRHPLARRGSYGVTIHAARRNYPAARVVLGASMRLSIGSMTRACPFIDVGTRAERGGRSRRYYRLTAAASSFEEAAATARRVCDSSKGNGGSQMSRAEQSPPPVWSDRSRG